MGFLTQIATLVGQCRTKPMLLQRVSQVPVLRVQKCSTQFCLLPLRFLAFQQAMMQFHSVVCVLWKNIFETVPSCFAHWVTKRGGGFCGQACSGINVMFIWSVSDGFSLIVLQLCQSETVLIAGFHAQRSSVVCACHSFITSWCSHSTWARRLWSVQTKA